MSLIKFYRPMDNCINFDAQYCESYNSRFSEMRKLVLENPEVSSRGLEVKELKDDLSGTCLIVAIFFLKSDSKPSVLKSNNDKEKERICCYINDSAKYYLQDKSGTLEIIFTPDFDKLPALLTGMVLGFVGTLITEARFECSDIIFPNPLVNSGHIQSGMTGSILIAGNCLLNNGNIEKMKVIADYCREKISAIILIGDILGSTVQTDLLESWAKDIETKIFIVPGSNDQTTQMLPQYPIHPRLFSKDSIHSDKNPSGRIFLLQNPGRTRIEDVETVVLSQRIINDIAKYVPGNETEEQKSQSVSEAISEELFMNLLEQLVMARHIAPNAPDTLSCVPYSGRGPFILEKCDLLIAGGCRRACSRMLKGCAVVGVPNFDTTGTAVLFSPKNASVEEVSCAGL